MDRPSSPGPAPAGFPGAPTAPASAPPRRPWRRAFDAYADWLVGIRWRIFLLWALLLLIAASVLEDIPPFNIPWGADPAPAPTVHSQPSDKSPVRIEGVKGRDGRQYEVTIDSRGVRVRPISPDSPAPAASADAPSPPPPPVAPGAAGTPVPAVPPVGGTVRSGDDARAREIERALGEAGRVLREVGPATVVMATAGTAADDEDAPPRRRAFRLGDPLQSIAFLFIVLSAVIKLMAAGRRRAEVRADAATEQAQAETLRRQVVEARLSAMQAQVEPHFLFNTLASIDHLIETDPPRASRMQKNLIALLRASMPTLRETAAIAPRELGRELDVVRPYLEILQVRMEDRLQASVDVPEGLLSAEFPPMMIQGLVENAIRHGLEPKAEGGRLHVTAAIEHGRLAVCVTDSGIGLPAADLRSATAGSGTGLANIRERLRLLYGDAADLQVGPAPGGGTLACIRLPYRMVVSP